MKVLKGLFSFSLLVISSSLLAQSWQWAISSGTTTMFNVGISICVDSAGNNYTTGSMSGTYTFGTCGTFGTGGRDIFTTKYDANGNCQWVEDASSTGATKEGQGIAIDKHGNIL